MPQVIINFVSHDVRVAVSPGCSLLDAARRAGIRLGEDCGGQGECGQCWVKILEGETSSPSQDEKRCLAESGVPENYRLACCTRVLSEAKVFIPAALKSAG